LRKLAGPDGLVILVLRSRSEARSLRLFATLIPFKVLIGDLYRFSGLRVDQVHG